MPRGSTVAACLLLIACSKAKHEPHASPPAIDAAVRAIDAAPPAIDAAPVPAVDPFLIAPDGVGPIVKFKGVEADDQASIAALQELLAGSGLDVTFEVMDVGNGDTEEGYYSIRQGDDELAQVMRTEPFMTVHAVSPRYHTADGVHVGDALPVVIATRPALACTITGHTGFLSCRSPDQPDVLFALDGACAKGRPPAKDKAVAPASLGACKIVEIVR